MNFVALLSSVLNLRIIQLTKDYVTHRQIIYIYIEFVSLVTLRALFQSLCVYEERPALSAALIDPNLGCKCDCNHVHRPIRALVACLTAAIILLSVNELLTALYTSAIGGTMAVEVSNAPSFRDTIANYSI